MENDIDLNSAVPPIYVPLFGKKGEDDEWRLFGGGVPATTQELAEEDARRREMFGLPKIDDVTMDDVDDSISAEEISARMDEEAARVIKRVTDLHADVAHHSLSGYINGLGMTFGLSREPNAAESKDDGAGSNIVETKSNDALVDYEFLKDDELAAASKRNDSAAVSGLQDTTDTAGFDSSVNNGVTKRDEGEKSDGQRIMTRSMSKSGSTSAALAEHGEETIAFNEAVGGEDVTNDAPEIVSDISASRTSIAIPLTVANNARLASQVTGGTGVRRGKRKAEDVILEELSKLCIQCRNGLCALENQTLTAELLFTSQMDSSRLCVLYAGATGRVRRRTLVIVFELPRGCTESYDRIGSVRFTVPRGPNEKGDEPSDNEINAMCSCSPLGEFVDCPHIRLLNRSNTVRSEIRFILGMGTGIPIERESRSWHAISIGNRSDYSVAMWITVRRDAKSYRALNYVPVTEGITGRRGKQHLPKRMKCTHDACNRHSSHRGNCEHELACVNAAMELGAKNNDGGDEPSAGQTESGRKPLIDYRSKLPRRILPCPSDYEAIYDLLIALSTNQRKRCETGGVDEHGIFKKAFDSFHEDFVACDHHRICRNHKCKFVLLGRHPNRNCEAQKRPVLLHTLVYGSACISVTDLKCPKCGTISYFDGRDDAMYVHSRLNVFSRELIDVWLYVVAMLGGTFREAYELSRLIAGSASARFSRWGGLPVSMNRITANRVFTAFLQLVEYPAEETLSHLFTCSTCEVPRNDGTKHFRAIVMDGTATGILGDLPMFDRPKMFIPAPNNTGPSQYIVSGQYVRKFLNSFFKKAGRGQTLGRFEIDLPQTPSVAQSVKKLFFRDPMSSTTTDFGTNLAMLYEVAFEAPRFEEFLNKPDVNCKKMLIKHRLHSCSLRSALADFSSGLLYESIPVVVLKDDVGIQAAHAMADLLDKFRKCNHNSTFDSRRTQEFVCTSCTDELAVSCRVFMNVLPTTSRLVFALVAAQCEDFETPLRTIAKYASNILRRSLEVNASFRVLFDQKHKCEAKDYCAMYETPFNMCEQGENSGNQPLSAESFSAENKTLNSAANELLNTVLLANNSSEPTIPDRHDLGFSLRELRTINESEAAICGELFPGRQLCRPRITFKNEAGEHWREDCAKEYRSSHTHSPGLFTLQCACEHPKLIGVSVMDENESISTALNAIMTRFPRLPQITFYDNACNLSRSTRLRFPWVFKQTTFVVDRFHYASHRCSALFDPDTFRMCKNLPTSGAEAINRQWKTSRTHVRFLSHKNLVPFVYTRMFFLNIRAQLKDKCERTDVEDMNIYDFVNEHMPCTCWRCDPHAKSQ